MSGDEQPRIAGGRVSRVAPLVGMAGRTAGEAVAASLRKRRQPDADLTEFHIKQAERYAERLGRSRGVLMKAGQMLSFVTLDSAVDAPYRGIYQAAFARLQDDAPPMPPAMAIAMVTEELGRSPGDLFAQFDPHPLAAASIGQVHAATLHDGRRVAVKVQYPGAGAALLGDLNQLSRLARLFGVLVPGLDVKPLVTELKERVAEELDYALEADSQQAFAAAFDGDPDICVPKVVHQSGEVIVTEWIDGTPLSKIISDGDQDTRDRAGVLYHRFHLIAPARAGKLHADPHPGNFRMLPDGRLGVLDFGAVARLPDGLPPEVREFLAAALAGDGAEVVRGLKQEGFIKAKIDIDPDKLLSYLLPFLEPVTVDGFRFSRSWLRAQATRISDPRSAHYYTGLQLNLPPKYLLIHRVWLGTIGVLCQLEAGGPWRDELNAWLPGDQEIPDPAARA